jgi:hypothetical protein
VADAERADTKQAPRPPLVGGNEGATLSKEQSSSMTKKVLSPTVSWQTEDVWAALDDRERAELIETITRLATERLEQLAQARKGGAIPWKWYEQDWTRRGGGHALGGYTFAVKELNGA